MSAELIDALRAALSAMTTAVYVGSDDDRKIALMHLLEVWAVILVEAEA